MKITTNKDFANDYTLRKNQNTKIENDSEIDWIELLVFSAFRLRKMFNSGKYFARLNARKLRLSIESNL